MLSNSSLDMLNESLTYIICKTVRFFYNNAIYLNCMRIYSLTELIEEAVKVRPYIHSFYGKNYLWNCIRDIEDLFFTCSELENNISVNKERIN